MSTLITNKCIGFIGVGVMGSSIIKSLLKNSLNSDQICISDKSAEKAEEIAGQYKVKIKSIIEIGQSCDVIFLAVKPQDLEAVLLELKKALKPNVLVISIAAGKKIEFIEEHLASEVSVVRVMPNTPAQIGKGISAIAAGSKSSKEDMELATKLFLATGEVVEVTEEMLDAVTALSGSGPAYFFNFVESMIKAGVELGLSNEIATKLAIETISGSAAMLKESGLDAQTLRKNVTSPKGTTAAALQVFSDNNFDSLILQAMSAAKKKGAGVSLRKILALLVLVVVSLPYPVNAATIKATKSLIELPYTKSDQVSDVVLTPVSILLVGTTESPSSTWINGALGGFSDGFITSYSSIGAPMWNLRLGGVSDEIATSAAIDSDGSIWVLGASSSPATATASPTPAKVLNPDNVIIDPQQISATPLKRIKVWQVSNTGNLLNSFEFLSENIVNPKKILISGSNLYIIGNLYEKNLVSGFSTLATKSGIFSPIIKVGSKSTSLNDAIINSDGTITAVGTSGELLMKAKPLSKADAVTIKISSTGVLQQVARATLKGTTRNWSSIDSGLLQAGKVSYSNKTEAAITKFSALSKPVWNVRYLSKSTALATAGKNSWATFVSAGAIKNITAWKPKSSTAVVLELGKKGEILSAYTLAAPAVAISSNNEIGTVVITDSGVSFGLVVVN